MSDMNMSLGNGYSIDMADGWTFVHAVEDALQQLRAGWAAHSAGLVFPPPGNDAHSKNFSQQMTQKIEEHKQWYDGQVTRLQSMITNGSGMLKQYGYAETANTVSWGAPDGSSPTGPSAPATGSGESDGGSHRAF